MLLAASACLLCLVACQPAARPTTSEPPAPPATTVAAAASTPEVDRLLAAARDAGETQLDLSWSASTLGGYEAMTRYEALFNRLYGTNVKLNLTPGPSIPDMQAKIIQEMAAGHKASTDVLFGGDTNFAAILPLDVLEAYDYTRLSPRITPDVVATGNIAVEVYTTIPAILFNTDLVRPADAPQRLVDVLDARWKGKIAGNQTVGELSRVAMRPDWGPERMRDFVARLAPQVGGLIRNGEEGRIVTGEFQMFVLTNDQSGRRQERLGAPIGYVIPPDAAFAGYQYLGVPRNAAHPNLAKLFVNMVLSEEGQRILWETYATAHHKLPGSPMAAEVAALRAKGTDLFDVDVETALQWPEMGQLRADLDRLMTTGGAR
jgi:iron(III) transport system substrate-binding protein